MRRLPWGMIVVSLWLAASAPAAFGAGTKVRVSPGSGGIHTNFTLRFSIPVATGTSGGVNVSDYVTVSGGRRSGCVGDGEVPLRPAPAHTAFRVTLNPSRISPSYRNGHWCAGTFTGRLMQSETSVCRPGPVRAAIVCPLFVLAPRVIGRFRFTVTDSTSR